MAEGGGDAQVEAVGLDEARQQAAADLAEDHVETRVLKVKRQLPDVLDGDFARLAERGPAG